jgi:predicted signal transduction protein with EAL and GGDEF domain
VPSDGNARLLPRRNGRLTHLYGLKQDITQERRDLEALRKLAEHDALTGLASRSLFQSRFLNSSAAARAAFPIGALALFDVDNFKQIAGSSRSRSGGTAPFRYASRKRAAAESKIELLVFYPEEALRSRRPLSVRSST